MVGRPVHFTVARSEEHDQLAISRLREAFDLAGIPAPVFEYEPGTWGPAEEERLVADAGGWHCPAPSVAMA